MEKYGTSAVRSVQLLRGGCKSADEAWQAAADNAFTDAPHARVKACSRETFLWLCQAVLSGLSRLSMMVG